MIRRNQTVSLSLLEARFLFEKLLPVGSAPIGVYEFNRGLDRAATLLSRSRDPSARAAGAALRALHWALRRPGYPLSTQVAAQLRLPFGEEFAYLYREIDLINTPDQFLAGRVHAVIDSIALLPPEHVVRGSSAEVPQGASGGDQLTGSTAAQRWVRTGSTQ